MKTHILHIELYDDVHSIQDKMNWGKSDRILMVFPNRRRVVDRKLDLLILKRHAGSIGAQIALVTKQQTIISFAAEMDIPVFRSLRLARRLPWESAVSSEPERFMIKPREKSLTELKVAAELSSKYSQFSRPGVRLAIFSIGVLAFITLLAVLLPSAEIRLTPQLEEHEISLDLSANPNTTNFSPAGILPAIPLFIMVEGRDSIQPSGSIIVPQQAAMGEVQFTNLTDQEILISEGTEVRTNDDNPIRFATIEDIRLPAESGTVETVGIQALNPGAAGNLAEETLIVVVGDLGFQVSAINLDATSGGSEKESKAPTQEDYDQLSAQLEEALWASAIQEAATRIGEDDFLILAAPSSINVLEEIFSPPFSQPVSELSLQLQIEYEILYVPADALHAVGILNLDAILPDGYQAKNETILVLPMSIPEYDDDGNVFWQVIAQRTIFLEININEIKDLTKGKRINSATQMLEANYLIENSPIIRLQPEWWPGLPILPLRITVIVE